MCLILPVLLFLRCAVLCCAVLRCAALCCAVLRCAVLCPALELACSCVLCCAVLCCAVLCCAVLCCAVLCRALELACSSSVHVVDRFTDRTKAAGKQLTCWSFCTLPRKTTTPSLRQKASSPVLYMRACCFSPRLKGLATKRSAVMPGCPL